jgi:subtilisin-like proprotein convertase family protein
MLPVVVYPSSSTPGEFFCNSDPISIPDSGAAVPYPSTVVVTDQATQLVDVNVHLFGLNHTWPDDIDILLVGPQGQNLIIMSDAGGSLDLVNVDLVLDDAATGYLPDSAQISSGTYRPTNYGTGDTFPVPAPAPSSATALAIINGTEANGTWSLYVMDDASGDAGSISGGWCLELTGGNPNIDVDPLSLISTQLSNTVTQQALDIANTGNVDLNWMVNEEPVTGPTPADQATELDAIDPEQTWTSASPGAAANVDIVTDASQCSLYDNYVGAEPLGYAEFCAGPTLPAIANAPEAITAPTDVGYAQDIGFVSDNFVSFTLNDFPGQSILGSNTLTLFGMDFDPTGSTLYALDNNGQQLGTMNLTSGAFTPIGSSIPLASHTWTGLTIDPINGTFYASSTDGATAALYTLDPATGAASLINTQTTTPLLIDIAMNPDGVMYGHDISTDSIYTIDPSTAAATLVGLTGYNANFAQGMDFDNDDGTLYIFLYLGGGANVYGTVNLTTGAVTPLSVDNPQGEFEGAIKTSLVCSNPADVPWLSLAPDSGVTPSGATSQAVVTFDSTGLVAGDYHANLCITSNDPDSGPGNQTELVVVPVELVVVEGEAGIEIVKTVGTQPGVCAATSSIMVAPGTTVYYCYTVTNTGSVALNTHELLDDQLGTIFLDYNYALDPSSSINTVAAGLEIPVVINNTTTNLATWRAYNVGGVTATATALASATVYVKDFDLAPEAITLSGAPGATVEYTLTLTNNGDASDTYVVTLAGNTWDVSLPIANFTLATGESTDVIVYVTIPHGAEDGDSDKVTVTAALIGNLDLSASSELTTTVVAEEVPYILYLPAVFTE